MTAGTSPRVSANSWIALGFLFLIGILNYLDRTLLNLLQIPVKEELGLTDTQLGILLGLAFAVVYTTFGLPLGRLADRTSRRGVLIAALVIWTGLTSLTGLSTGFVMLLVCRMGVALGEAACAPVSHSLISDLFPRQRRAMATAIWGAAIPVGSVLGFALGGWLGSKVGWRDTFISVGAIGLLLAVPAWLLIKEPKRGQFDRPTSVAETPRMSTVLGMMWRNRSYRWILIAAALHLLTYHAFSVWQPQFLARVHHLKLQDIAWIMALIAGLGGGLGTLLSGVMTDVLTQRDGRWYVWLSAIAGLIAAPLTFVQLWSPSLPLVIALGVVNGALMQVFFAPMIAATQSLMPPGVRTFTGAFYVFFANIFSMSLGPLAVGILSDVLKAGGTAPVDALRIGMSTVVIGAVLAIPAFFMASRTLREDLALQRA